MRGQDPVLGARHRPQRPPRRSRARPAPAPCSACSGLAFRDLVLELAAGRAEPPRTGPSRPIGSGGAGRARHGRDGADLSRPRSPPSPVPARSHRHLRRIAAERRRPGAAPRLRDSPDPISRTCSPLTSKSCDAPLRRSRDRVKLALGPPERTDAPSSRSTSPRARAWSANCSRRSCARRARRSLCGSPRSGARRLLARIAATLPLLQRPRAAARRGRQRRDLLHLRRGAGMRRDRAPHRRRRRPVRRHRHPAALAGTASAAGPRSAAAGGQSRRIARKASRGPTRPAAASWRCSTAPKKD